MRVRASTVVRGGLALLLVGAVALAVHQLGRPAVRSLVEHTRELGVWAPLAYAALGGVLIAACLPASLVFLGAGVLFGAWQGSAVAAGATLSGSCLGFWAARWLGRPRIRALVDGSAKLARVDRALEHASLRTLLLLRLSPVVPLWFLNLSVGASRIRFRTFLASVPAGLPAIFLYVYSGHAARGLFDGGQRASRTPLEWTLLGVGLVATVVAAWRVRKLSTRVLGDGADDDGTDDDGTDDQMGRPGERRVSGTGRPPPTGGLRTDRPVGQR